MVASVSEALACSFPRVGMRVRLDLAPGGQGAIVRRADGSRVGEFAIVEDSNALIIDALCVDAAARGYGLGSEAAGLLREACAEHCRGRIRAWAPPDRGLAVYFWSRMGFRPLFGERPGGGIWFERSVP